MEIDLDKFGVFETSDVVEVVGISPIYLNKFVERGLYGIAPSARPGEGRGSRRWFSLDDVFGIALVWWLFEAGLRTEVIKRVLCDLSKSKKADANLAAKAVQKSGEQYLTITRDVRRAGSKQSKTPQAVEITDTPTATRQHESPNESLFIIPVGKFHADLLGQLKARVKSFEARR